MPPVLAAEHFSELAPADWPFRFFAPAELASRGDGSLRVVLPAAAALDELRLRLRCPLRVLSAYRDPLHNARVGGAPRSRHKQGDAFDLALAGLNRHELAEAAAELGFTGFGRYANFLHLDARPRPASWYGGRRSRELWNG